MKWKAHLVIPAAALLLQLGPPVFIWIVATLAYGVPPRLEAAWIWPVSMAGLAFWAAAGLVLGGVGTYLLLVRARPRTAVALIVVCCIPSITGGAVYSLALLSFLSIA